MQVEMAARDGVRRSFPTSDWVEMAARDADSARVSEEMQDSGISTEVWRDFLAIGRIFPMQCY
jgi:hypothetical protein